jgi:alpha-glucoside transport system substrate-binding protein
LPVLAGLGAAGCGSGEQTVQVAVVWTGWELTQFERVMKEFSRRYNVGYSLLSMGDDTTAFLSNKVTALAQPDVALIPQPGLVRSDSTQKLLAQVNWPAADAPSWRSLLAASPAGSQYGVWFKAAHESMVWYDADLHVPAGGWDWDTWVGQCQALAKRGRPPLSIGAADGWVVALWFANVLLSIDPPLYHMLALKYRNGPVVGRGPTWDNQSVRLGHRRRLPRRPRTGAGHPVRPVGAGRVRVRGCGDGRRRGFLLAHHQELDHISAGPGPLVPVPEQTGGKQAGGGRG